MNTFCRKPATLPKIIARRISQIYRVLLKYFGCQYWWPGDSDFEIVVGAVLTQNTNWQNVTKALHQLKTAQLLTVDAIDAVSHATLAQHIKSAGYYNLKAKRLKNVATFILQKYQGSLVRMHRVPIEELRRQWLEVNGVGEETADSILLYALGKPVFVVDAYTRRFLYRHNLIEKDAQYRDIQKLFHAALKPDVAVFNEFHALIVELGKKYCKPIPDCTHCPLGDVAYDRHNRCQICFRAHMHQTQQDGTAQSRRCGCVNAFKQ